MAGLLAWAADVVGGSGHEDDDDDDEGRLPVAVFTPEQQQYARELDRKAASLKRSIQDLRLRIPPPLISQRLPHLHAHSLASNAALALQLNAHSTTREQAQLREATLQEENVAYEKAISNCHKKIKEKSHEADVLQSKLKEMDSIEKDIKADLEKKIAAAEFSQSVVITDDSINTGNFYSEGESSINVKLEELEDKKRELRSVEEMVQSLESQWCLIQQDSVKLPSPAQREKLLEKQLHGLIEQLMAKQAQAEGLIREIHAKENELEGLNGLRRRSDGDVSNTRGRSGRGIAGSVDAHRSRSYNSGGRTENQLLRLMLLKPAFVLYILALHMIVFIKISF